MKHNPIPPKLRGVATAGFAACGLVFLLGLWQAHSTLSLPRSPARAAAENAAQAQAGPPPLARWEALLATTPGTTAAHGPLIAMARPKPVAAVSQKVAPTGPPPKVSVIVRTADQSAAMVDGALIVAGQRLPSGARVSVVDGDSIQLVSRQGRREVLRMNTGAASPRE